MCNIKSKLKFSANFKIVGVMQNVLE